MLGSLPASTVNNISGAAAADRLPDTTAKALSAAATPVYDPCTVFVAIGNVHSRRFHNGHELLNSAFA
jgi:hypothetical protein